MKIILKLTKSLFSIMLLTLIIVMVFSWSSASPEKREEILEKINTITPFDIFKAREKIQNIFHETIQKIDSDTINKGISLLNTSIGKSTGHFEILDLNCGTVEPIEIDRVSNNQKKIYQWTDEQGRTHFGDAKQDQNAKDISEQYRSRNTYININIENINYSSPITLNNRIELSIQKMFMVLSESLSIAQLNQLELSLKVFGEMSEFNEYLEEKAPALKGFAAGFYLPDENEASVSVQSNEQSTLNIIRHESSHVIMANLYGRSPIWLNEGFAEYFSELKISGFETTVYPSNHALKLLKEQATSGDLSLEKHLNLSPKQWQGSDISLHYAEAWSIVYFLLSDDYRKNILKGYMNELSNNRCVIIDSSAYFNNNFPGGLTAMNDQWLAWIAQREIYPHRY